MTVKNPGSESAANQLPGLTPEIVQQLESGRMKVAELNETQLRQLVEDEDDEKAPVGTPAVPPQAPAAAPQTPSPKVEPKAEAGAGDVDGEAYRKKADELNTVKQKLEKSDLERETLRAQLEASRKAKEAPPTPKKTVDDEGFFESMEERLSRLEAENKELRGAHETVLESKVKSLDDVRKESAVELTFLDIESFQYRSKQLGMDLKTENSVRQIDVQIAAVEKAHGVAVVNRMKTDKAFRDEMATKGVVLPNEWEKHDVIMRVHDFKKAKGYPTFTSAFADFFASSGLQKRQIAETSLEVARATADKLIQSSNETPLIPADSGAGGASHLVDTQKWTAEKAQAWMNAHPTPKTKEEMAIQYEIMTWLNDQPD